MLSAQKPEVGPRRGPGGGWRAAIRFSLPADGGAGDLWYEGPGTPDDVDCSCTPWAVALAPLAFHLGADLEMPEAVDPRVAAGLESVFGTWSRWYGKPRVRLRAPVAAEGPTTPVGSEDGQRLAAFFSGGVDSMWTALDQPTPAADTRDLITVHGFDIPLSEEQAFNAIAARFAPWARSWGGTLVPLRTNFRLAPTGAVPWGELAHGCALIAAGLLLSPRYDVVRIAATGGVRDPHPWGSHLQTDPLLGSSRTRIEHHGAEATRWQKVERIAADDAALSLLRVCWRSQSDRNCGHCSKCLRTMALLELFGALQRAPTFPDRLPLDRLARVHVAEGWDVREFNDLDEQATLRGRPDLARTARRAMRRTRRRERMLRWIRLISKTPGLRAAARASERRLRSGWIR